MSRNYDGDELLLAGIRQDNTASFEELYHRYFFPLYIYSLKKLGSKEDARQIVRDLFVDLWQNRHELYPSQGISGYLYAAVRQSVVRALTEKISKQGSYFFSRRVAAEFSAESLQKSKNAIHGNRLEKNVEVVNTVLADYPPSHIDLHKYYSWLDMKWLVNMLRIKQTA